jgi:hypothetical protein
MDGIERMETMATNRPRPGEFFILAPDVRRGGPGHGVVFENRKALMTPPRLILRPEEGGFPPLRETPRLVHQPKEGDLPQDLEGGFSGYWLVSKRLRKVMESVDPDAFVLRKPTTGLLTALRGQPCFSATWSERWMPWTKRPLSSTSSSATSSWRVSTTTLPATCVWLSRRTCWVLRTSSDCPITAWDREFKDAVEAAGIVTPSDSNGLWFDDVVNR